MDRRKELKRQYLETEKPIGAYRITNNINGKMLVGAGINLDAIFNRFRFTLTYGGYSHNISKEFIDDWKKYGENNFTFEILETLKQSDNPDYDYTDDLKILEEIWLDKLQPNGERGYNKKPAGEGRI